MNQKLLPFVSLLLLTGTVSGQTEILPDPTRPVGYNEFVTLQEIPGELVDWKLTAIRISVSDRSAIINNKLVRAGEIIGSAKVLEIGADGVTLIQNNKPLKIRLYGETSIKNPVKNKR